MNHGTLDVSLDCISGSVHRVLDQVSTATLTLQNPRNKYIKDNVGEPIFRPMDRITIFLTRIYQPMQVFSGYLDEVPYEQFIPGTVVLNASCTLKRLLYTYFDPSLTYTQTRLAKFGWIFDPNSGSLTNYKTDQFDLDYGGGLRDLMRFMLHEVGGWDISKSEQKRNTVHIMPLPESYLKKTGEVVKKQMAEASKTKENVDSILKAIMSASGDGGSTTTTISGGGYGDTKPVPTRFSHQYQGNIYGCSVVEPIIGNVNAGPKAKIVVDTALSEQGVPYRWGGGEPDGFDCSGLIQYCYRKVGIELPHNAGLQFNDPRGKPVSRQNLVPGDCVYFHGAYPGHCGIALGNDQFIHAPHTGDVVKISSLETAWYKDNWTGARRFIEETPAPKGGVQFNLIVSLSQKYKIDPAAALAIASAEGGFDPTAVGDGGHAFGPFQLNDAGGAMPDEIKAKGPAYEKMWADSEAGIDFAMQNVLNGSINKTGEAAIIAMVQGERPGDYIAGINAGLSPEAAAKQTRDYRVAMEAYPKYLAQVGTGIGGGGGTKPPCTATGQIGDVRVPPGFPVGMTFHITPNPYNAELVFKSIKQDATLGPGQISIYVPGAEDNSTAQAKLWHERTDQSVVVETSFGGDPFDTGNVITVDPLSTAGVGSVTSKTFDFSIPLGEDLKDTVQDIVNISNNVTFGNQLFFPTAGGVIEAEALIGQHALYNDIPLMKWMETAVTASGRRFQSMPNGDFLAFYPNYFRWATEEDHASPYLKIADLEIISGDITLTDKDLITHYFTTADLYFKGGNLDIWDEMRSAVASVESHGAFESFTNQSKDFDAIKFLQRYGARPFPDTQENIKHPVIQFLYGWQKFLLKWSRQFACNLETTFLPEIYPGGLVEIPSKDLIMFVEDVTHSWNREAGFTTNATLTAPATVKRKSNPGMVLAGNIMG